MHIITIYIYILQEETYCISFIIIVEIQDGILIWIWKLAW